MKNALVTGGAGFIGSHVSREAIKLGFRTVILDDLSGGFRENLPVGAEFIEGSVTDHRLLSDLFQKYQFDYVYHLAAYAAESLSHFIRRFNYENNLLGSINLINQSVIHKVKCFVFTSSIGVYGKIQPPFREDEPPVPADPYGISKLAVEQDLRCSYEMFGLNHVIFRPHNVYGVHQNIGDKYRNVVGIFMNQLMSGQPLTIFGDGEQTRAFSWIEDIAPAIAGCVAVKEAQNEIFNIGADETVTVRELAIKVCKAMDMRGEIRCLPSRIEAMHAFSDHSKFESVFGSMVSTPLDAGLARMAAWVKMIGPRRSRQFDQIEIMEKLPPVWSNNQPHVEGRAFSG